MASVSTYIILYDFFIFLHKILVSFNDNANWFDLVQSLFIMTLKGRW